MSKRYILKKKTNFEQQSCAIFKKQPLCMWNEWQNFI